MPKPKKPEKTHEKPHRVHHFVYPYYAQPAQWAELRYSVRALVKHFKEPFKVFIVSGEKPKYLSDEVGFIYVPDNSPKNPPLNIARKLKAVCENPNVNENFIWMNDDIYLLKNSKYKDLAVHTCTGTLQEKRYINTVYSINKYRTYEVLSVRKLPTYDYSTHLPFIYNKYKMAKLIEEHSLTTNALLISSLYFNTFFSHVQPLLLTEEDNIKLGLYAKHISGEYINTEAKRNRWMNNSQTGFSDVVKKILMQRFPKKTALEL